MKHLILFTLFTTLMSNFALASSKKTVEGKGEVETECPWAKQDERNGDNNKVKAIEALTAKKKTRTL